MINVILERNCDGTYFIHMDDHGTIANGLSLESGRMMLRALHRARYLDTTGMTIVTLNRESA